ncbi:MAG: hypothetical protein ABWY47_20660, partial [Xanthobacteraceae bacterium]
EIRGDLSAAMMVPHVAAPMRALRRYGFHDFGGSPFGADVFGDIRGQTPHVGPHEIHGLRERSKIPSPVHLGVHGDQFRLRLPHE